MADQRVNGNLILIGSNGGTVAIGAQASGGGFTYLLPTAIPQVGQFLMIDSVFNGNTATAKWASLAAVSYQTVQQAGVNVPARANLNFLSPITATDNPGHGSTDIAVPTFVGSGASHAIGLVPDPGASAGTTRFLREDATFAVPAYPVVSVFGRAGAVVAQSGDYTYAQISGTPQLPVTFGAAANQFLTSYTSTTGLFTAAQPSFSNLSGSIATGQIPAATVTVAQINATGTPLATTFLRGDGSWAVPSTPSRVASINYAIDGGGSVPSTGFKGQLSIPASCTLTGWVITADQSGSAVVDVLRSTYAGFPTTSSIAGTDLPTLITAQKNEDLTLTGWGSTAINAGDQIQFHLNSVATVTRLNVTLNVTIP
jgi:hypothetical protein